MPLTATGFTPRTRDEILESIQARLRARISAKLSLTERTVLGNWSNIAAEDVDDLEQLVAEAYSAQDPLSASDDRFVAIASQAGVPRRGATRGLVEMALNFGTNGEVFAPGSIVFQVYGEPENTWRNRDTITAVSPGLLGQVFVSDLTGAAAKAESGTLSVQLTPGFDLTHVGGGANLAAATPGQDIESIAALRVRWSQSVNGKGGTRSLAAIRAALLAVDGVLSVEMAENTGSTVDASGLAPGAIRATVWDGSPAAADDDDLAQAIYDRKAEGVFADGTVQATAQDPDLGAVGVRFSRATVVNVTIATNVQVAAGVGAVAAADVAAAIRAKMPSQPGQKANYDKLAGAIFDVPGVDDRTTFTVNGGTVDLPAVPGTIYVATAVNVTGDVV